MDGSDWAQLNRTLCHGSSAQLVGKLFCVFGPQLSLGKPIWTHDRLHRFRVIKAWFVDLKGGQHLEDRLAVLRRQDVSSAEAAAIANTINGVDNRLMGIAQPQKVRMQRMNVSICWHRLYRCA